jgi:hypothetical protein
MTILNNVNVGRLEQAVKEAEKLAYKRCPAVFALTEKVKLSTSLEIKGNTHA